MCIKQVRSRVEVSPVLSPFASSISTFEYLLFAFKDRKNVVLPRGTIHLSIRGIGYASFTNTAFRRR